MRRLKPANTLALAVPLALLAGAWESQLLGGLYPCEMCHWQRWPHYAAVVLAGLAFIVPGRAARGMLIWLAAAAIALSGAIGVFHAGVEYHWWHGVTACTATTSLVGMDAGQRLDALFRAPVVRCDQAQWTLFGISLAGFNAIFSLGGAAIIVALMRRAQ